MTVHIYGAAPDVIAAPLGGTTTFFYRYELVGDALVRRKVAETRPFVAGEARLIDVLLDEDETGRHINVIRGILVPERDLDRLGTVGPEPSWREFEVGLDVRLAIGRDLGVGLRFRPPLRLVTRDGRRVDDQPSVAAR